MSDLSLLERGLSFYLEAEEILQDDSSEFDVDSLVDLNPGQMIGYSLGALYVIWPVDIIPDWIPVIGYLDDIAILRLSGAVGGLIYDVLDFIF